MRSKSKRNALRTSIFVLIALCMCLLTQISSGVEAYAEPADDGRFVIMAVNEDGWVIEPEYLTYTESQTIRDALIASDHEFGGIDTGFIHSIDGKSFPVSLFYDGNEWDLDQPASKIRKALVFTWRNEDVYGDDEAYLDLAVKLAEYSEMDHIKKNYAPIKNAYDSAHNSLPVARSTKATQLLDAITTAENDYEEWLAETPCNVTFDITQKGHTVNDAVCIIKDKSEHLCYEGMVNETAELRSGTYVFIIHKGMNQVEGEFTVEKNNGSKTIQATLPGDEWFGEIGIGVASGSNWKALPMDTDPEKTSITTYIPDSATGIYPYIVPGDAINNTADKKTHRFYVDALSTENKNYGDESVSSNARTWESKSTSASKIVSNGLAGRDDIRFKVIYKGEDGYTQRQFKELNIIRTPTLKGLTVKEPSGTELLLEGTGESKGFKTEVKEYEVTTTADQLIFAGSTLSMNPAYGSFSEGYSISIDGTSQHENGQVPVSVEDGDVVTVKAVAENGCEDVYSIKINKREGVSLRLNKENGNVTVHLLNSANSKILPDSESATSAEFTVAPGEYTWVGTLDGDYHTSATVNVSAEGGQGEVATPQKEELLKDLYVKVGSGAKTLTYDESDGKLYNWQDHEYKYTVWDNCSTFYIFYEVSDKIKTKKGNVIRGSYIKQNDGGTQAPLTKNITSSTTGNQVCGNFVITGEENNSLTYRVEYVESGVTYYQEYSIATMRKPIAQGITLKSFAAGTGRTAGLEQKEGSSDGSGFDYLVNEYTAVVPRGSDELRINVSYSEIKKAGTGQFVIKSGESEVDRTMEAGTAELAVPLDPIKDLETIEVVMDSQDPGNIPNTYVIEVRKTDPVNVTFNVTPEDHNLIVTDKSTGEVLTKTGSGSYSLMEGSAYRYTVTAYGYIGQQVDEYIATEDETIEIRMDKAPENQSLNTELEADWPMFRFDADNNGVTDYLTPVEAEKTTLYWANKVGEGYGSGATGCPIIVGDYLYTYAGKNIIKIDRYTGDVVKSAEMSTNSPFAINSPTYAEGMIFVALSGKVQAFNAETLESLWVYSDPIGGQPNCPIAYHNGYIYTGFWKSETKPANFVCLSVTDEDPESGTEDKLPSWIVEDNGFYWAGAYVGPGAYSQDNTYILVGTDDGDSGYTKNSGNLLSIDRKTGLVIDRYEGVCKGDIRSSISHENGKFYFTSKGGYFCSIQINENGTFNRSTLKKLYLSNSSIHNDNNPPMSTSTPCIYNGRAYVGVSGTGQFSAYSGHNITVIDLQDFRIAYTVDTKGYPQTSGLLTTAYGKDDGSVYVYFVDNYTPGVLRMIKDSPGQDEPANLGQETMTVDGQEVTKDVAYTLWTPFGEHAQYAICSPISDEHGNIYFKNDSAYMMMLGATIDSLEITRNPTRTTYRVGESFDPNGMKVTAHYSNGTSRDVTKYITYRNTPFEDDEIGAQPVELSYYLGENMKTYQDRNGQAGQEYVVPTAVVDVTIVDEGTFIPKPLTEEMIALDNTDFTYAGSVQKPQVTVRDGDETLTDADYDIVNDGGVNVGSYTVTITGKGNYSGSITKNYVISKADNNVRITNAPGWTTGADPVYPSVSAAFGSDTVEFTYCDSINGSYTASVPTTKGTYYVKAMIPGTDNYSDAVSDPVAFSISETADVPKTNISTATITIPAVTYNGRIQQPTPVVKLGGITLARNKDYKVTYKNNIHAGTATATITGMGNYIGTKNQNFTINKAKNTLLVAGNTVTVSHARLKKANQYIPVGNVRRIVRGGQGTITYMKVAGTNKISVTRQGKITVSKGLKKGRYRFILRVICNGRIKCTDGLYRYNYNVYASNATVTVLVK